MTNHSNNKFYLYKKNKWVEDLNDELESFIGNWYFENIATKNKTYHLSNKSHDYYHGLCRGFLKCEFNWLDETLL